jgi:hypothetical protein
MVFSEMTRTGLSFQSSERGQKLTLIVVPDAKKRQKDRGLPAAASEMKKQFVGHSA